MQRTGKLKLRQLARRRDVKGLTKDERTSQHHSLFPDGPFYHISWLHLGYGSFINRKFIVWNLLSPDILDLDQSIPRRLALAKATWNKETSTILLQNRESDFVFLFYSLSNDVF